MRKTFIAPVVAFALLFGAFSVHAAALTETQIQSIMSLLSAFGADASVVANVNTSLHGGNPTPPGNGGTNPTTPACPVFSRGLSMGASGSDVTSLQGFLGVTPTGSFDLQTQTAVQNWQASQGIVTSGSVQTTGFGAVGPKTIAAIRMRCAPSPTTGADLQLQARPTSGSAPLTVNFHTTSNPKTSPTTLSVDFGDGTSGTLQSDGMLGSCIAGVGGPCNGYEGLQASHIYTVNGTYTAKLMLDTCPAGAQCLVGPRAVSTVTITVGSSTNQNATLHATPTSGSAPLSVSFWYPSQTNPTFAPNNVQYLFDFGDGATATPVTGCAPNPSYNGTTILSCMTAFTASHTYSANGTYTATLTIAGSEPAPVLASVKITVGSNTSTNPPCCKI